MKLKKADRQNRIVIGITANSALSVSELATDLGVSKQTVRRDLDELSFNGKINRTYGGAATRPVGIEPSLFERQRMSQHERGVIADLALELIEEADTLMIGTGATTYRFAQSLVTRFKHLHVFTSSLSIASLIGSNPGHRVILTPGTYDSEEGCVGGPETCAFLEKFRADVSVFGCSGIDNAGVYEVNSEIAWTDRSMLENSRRNILLVPAIKFGEPHLETICSLGKLDTLVSDGAPDATLMRSLNENNVDVIITSVDQ